MRLRRDRGLSLPRDVRPRLVLMAGASTLVALALLAPSLHSPWLYALARPFCHQRAGRCFWLGGLPLAFCARCFGIYAGAALALVLGLRPSRRLFLAMLALVLLDLLSESAGLRPPWSAGRFLTGLLAGGAAAPFVLRELLAAGRRGTRSLVPASRDWPLAPRTERT